MFGENSPTGEGVMTYQPETSVSTNLLHQAIAYLNDCSDPMAKMLREQFQYALELNKQQLEQHIQQRTRLW